MYSRKIIIFTYYQTERERKRVGLAVSVSGAGGGQAEMMRSGEMEADRCSLARCSRCVFLES